MYVQNDHYWDNYFKTGISNDDRRIKTLYPFGYATGENDIKGIELVGPNTPPHQRNGWYFDRFVSIAKAHFNDNRVAGNLWYKKFKKLLRTQHKALRNAEYSIIFDANFNDLISEING